MKTDLFPCTVVTSLIALLVGCTDKNLAVAEGWTTKPMATISGNIIQKKGDNHPFSIQVPGGSWHQDHGGMAGIKLYPMDEGDWNPSVTLYSSIYAVDTSDNNRYVDPQTVIVSKDITKEKRSVRSKREFAPRSTIVRVEVESNIPGGNYKCNFSQSVPFAAKDLEKYFKMGEAICASAKISLPAPPVSPATPPAPVAPGSGTTATDEPTLTAEMSAFVASGFGSHSKVEAALRKYGKTGLETRDMEIYDLVSPRVVGESSKGQAKCYAIEAKAGITTRNYDICWTGGKIVEVVDKGSR